jgi:hypothetical protein
MDAENELAVVGWEEQVLSAAVRSGEPPSCERCEGRIECFHGRNVRRAGALDRRPRDERVELAHPRLHFR